MIQTKQGRQVPLWIPTVLGVLVSIAVGVAIYRQSGNDAAMGTIAALIGTTITLQLELLLQHRRTAADQLRHAQLIAGIESVPWLPETLKGSIASLHATTARFSAPIVADLVRAAFEDCHTQLQDLERGHYLVRLTDDSWLYEALTMRTRQTLVAACPDSQEELDWWDSPMGDMYLQAQIDAIARGVVVRRVFIYREWTDRVEALALRHHEAGIITLRVQRRQLRGDLWISMILWDKVCASEIELNDDGAAYAARYTVAPHDVARNLARFRLIESAAEVWPEPSSVTDDSNGE